MHPIRLTVLLLAASNVFMTFAGYVFMKEPPELDDLWAGLCILGAVYFIFRSRRAGA